MSVIRSIAIALLCICTSAMGLFAQEADDVFSGPQEGEKMADFKVLDVLENEGKSFQFMEKAGNGPVLLIFVHKVTRPSIGLIRTVVDEAATLKDSGLTAGMIFLSDDITAMQTRVKAMSRALPKAVTLGISPDKQEGPGAYGLNRNVSLTILVGKDGKVANNYALVQPSIQADALKIIAAAYKVAGKKNPPTLAQLMLRSVGNEKLRKPLTALLDLNAKDRDAAKLIKQVDDFVAQQPRAQQQLTGIAGRLGQLVQDQKYEDSVRAAVRRWGRRRGAAAGRARMSDKLSGLLRAVIQKDAREEDVIKANAALEAHIQANEKDRAEVGRIATTISNSGKLENYGTAKAQEFIKSWAKKYGVKRDAPKRDAPKRDAPKRDSPKRDAPKRDTPDR